MTESLMGSLRVTASSVKPQHPYWLPLPVSETTEFYCRTCAEKIIANRLRSGEILWEYVSHDDPEGDLRDLMPISQFGVPIESDHYEWCEECNVPMDVVILQGEEELEEVLSVIDSRWHDPVERPGVAHRIILAVEGLTDGDRPLSQAALNLLTQINQTIQCFPSE